MKFLLPLLALMIISAPALADHKIDIKVNGMVCDFCAQAVWKVFQEYDAVKDINVDLDTGIVTVNLKDGQKLNDDELKKAIKYSGYDLVEITHHDG